MSASPAPGDKPVYSPGSLEDFERLYRDSHQRILFTLLGVLRNREAAEDCAQEAFAKAFRSWARWKPDAPAEAWLHRIALNLAISYRRQQKIREVGEVLRRLGRPATVGGDADPASIDLLDALRALPREQAALVVLRHLHGYTNREIAHALRIPESTVASRLAAAKGRLRRVLAPADDGPVEAGAVVVEAASGVVLDEGAAGAT